MEAEKGLRRWRVTVRATGALRPWARYRAKVTHGPAIVGEAGHVWQASSPARLAGKVAKHAGRHAVLFGDGHLDLDVIEERLPSV